MAGLLAINVVFTSLYLIYVYRDVCIANRENIWAFIPALNPTDKNAEHYERTNGMRYSWG